MLKLITIILLSLSISSCASLKGLFSKDKPADTTAPKYVVDGEVRDGRIVDPTEIQTQEIPLADSQYPGDLSQQPPGYTDYPSQLDGQDPGDLSQQTDLSQQIPGRETAESRSVRQQRIDAIMGNDGEPIIFYFDFDSINLTQQTIAELIVYAKKMQENPEIELRLEGHADERGSRSYNLALGESRALAVKDVMALYSVEDRIEVVSYGEEKPQDEAHNEFAWQQNRRVELIFY